MPVLRNKLSETLSGGPRQHAELRDRFVISAGDVESVDEVRSELDSLGMRPKVLNNAPVITAEPQGKIVDVLERVRHMGNNDTKMRQGIKEIQDAADGEDNIVDITSSALTATTRLLREMNALSGVRVAEFVRTEADFGPENLRISQEDMGDVPLSTAEQSEDNLGSVYEEYGIYDAHQQETGDQAIVAIFDTGFAEDLIAPGRVINSFHGGGTDSVYESAEGHGSMCAGAAAASEEDGVPFDGAAPGSDVILVRITDDNGQIASDVISQGWDWLAGLNKDRPIVANHSYGTPICSGRPRSKYCDTAVNDVIKVVSASSDITSVYAAGNEAMKCGHRPAGFTNAITGSNSLGEVITVGALLSNGREAQRYSSHGRGDCAPISDPKPNVSFPIPKRTYYGTEDGWKIKDMSTGPYGSGGGTSHAAPTTAGMIALMQSKAMKERGEPMHTEEIKQIIEGTAEPPHKSIVNTIGVVLSQKGYDARFGNGKVNIQKALSEV